MGCVTRPTTCWGRCRAALDTRRHSAHGQPAWSRAARRRDDLVELERRVLLDSTPTSLPPLVGDGVADDTAAVQTRIDAAAAQGQATVALPAGTYRLTDWVELYGKGVTLSGTGRETVLEIDHHFSGGHAGTGLYIRPVFDPQWYYPSAPVSGATMVFNGPVPFAVGETLFLTNGRGGSLGLEQSLGGLVSYFNELAPDEYVQVAAVNPQPDGSTVVTLTHEVLGQGEYQNVLPAGAAPGEQYLHVRRLLTPAENITVRDMAITFADPNADTSILASYTQGLAVSNVEVLTEPTIDGGHGSIGIVGSENAHVTGVRSHGLAGIGLNSDRLALVESNAVSQVTMEEATTDSVVRYNVLRPNGFIGVRSGDLLCERNTIQSNTVLGAGNNYGGIGLWEARSTAVTANNVQLGAASIWVGSSAGSGNTVTGNTADVFDDYSRQATLTGNVAPSMPGAPSGLVAMGVSRSRLDVTWTDNSDNETGFTIERSTSQDFAAGTVVVVNVDPNPVGTPVLHDSGLAEGSQYYYRVAAQSSLGNSAVSNIATGVTTLTGPSGLAAAALSPTNIALSWVNGGTAQTGIRVERATDAAFTTPIAGVVLGPTATSYTDSGLRPGTSYYYRVRAEDAATVSSYTAVVAEATMGLASPWSGQDVGAVGAAGAGGSGPSGIVAQGSGAGVGGQADGFYFIYKALTGDGAIVAQVAAVSDADGNADVGVMMRDGLGANARNVAMLAPASATGSVNFTFRNATGGKTSVQTTRPRSGPVPTWVRLTRAGSQFSGYTSTDGTNWVLVRSVKMAMPTVLQVGLVVSSRSAGMLSQASFANVK